MGLAPAEQFLSKYPTDLSGGQKQRAVSTRSVILDPELLVAYKPISMLDMSVRAKILQLMLDLKAELGLTYVYITHDLATAKFFCDRVAIMYLGRVVEQAGAAEVFGRPNHPYTQALLAEVPRLDARARRFTAIKGEIPSPLNPPAGCHFHPRCPHAFARCSVEVPVLRDVAPGHRSACHLNDG